MINGVIVINKPQHMTSFDVVSRMRRILNQKKIGHTGTLDPMATGVLPICIGDATKIVDFLMDRTKTYVCEMKLGEATDTGDQWGSVIDAAPVPSVDLDVVRETVGQFIGEIEQIPPMYSAIKINGRKLVDLARQGVEIERQPRKITIYSIHDLTFDRDKIGFTVKCSKGTYVRTLCEDIAKALGTLGHMTALTRTSSEPFTMDMAVSLEQLEAEGAAAHLVSIETALVHFPVFAVELDEQHRKMLDNGVKFDLKAFADPCFSGAEVGMNPSSVSESFYRLYVNHDFYGICMDSAGKRILKKRFDD
ncbi:MAG: tRNA pseudouridine55 synthase [Clostridiales bacterium]|nr:tRNA pseudouridine55 synthase [Clostridiales bacterium]MDN5298168.1 tRNA pseudouridine55 synthase [Clostridiales bacterium]